MAGGERDGVSAPNRDDVQQGVHVPKLSQVGRRLALVRAGALGPLPPGQPRQVVVLDLGRAR